MIGTYGQVTQEEDGWFDCQGLSRFNPVLAPYCLAKAAREGIAERISFTKRLFRTGAILVGLMVLGSITFVGIAALRNQRRTRKNPRKKKQSLGNRLVRIIGGAALTGLGALGYAGPQAAEPISTVVGGGMSLSGLYLIGSGVIGVEQAKKLRKEIRG